MNFICTAQFMYSFLQSTEENDRTQGIVVGCYDTKDSYRLTGCGEGLDGQCSGQLSQLIDRLVVWSSLVYVRWMLGRVNQLL